MIYWCTMIAVACILGGDSAWGAAQDIGVLRTEQKRLEAIQDSLDEQRQTVVAEADELSSKIDGLKAEGSDPEELYEALRSSLVLVQRMVDIDRNVEGLKGQQDSLKEQLRLAYDWEIGMLIQKLSRQPDRGLLTQLMFYQEEREALGVGVVGTGLRYGEEMAIDPEDGPEEIRQKMELMEDIAIRLQTEAAETSEQLQRLEEEHRLRTRVRVFSSELSLFDEHLPEGRVLVRSQVIIEEKAEGPMLGDNGFEAAPSSPGIEEGILEDMRGSEDGSGAGSGAIFPVGQVLLEQREPDREGRVLSVDGVSVDDVTLEIHKLKAHQQEIHQLEGVVRERAAAFRQHLQKMLEGVE